MVSADLAITSHSHPVAEISVLGGPTVVFQLLFPRPGVYRLWAQFQRRGEVLTASFTVPVKGHGPGHAALGVVGGDPGPTERASSSLELESSRSVSAPAGGGSSHFAWDAPRA